MTSGRQIRFWLGGLAGALVFLWLLSDVLLPFVAGMAIAYFLDPLADRMERLGMPRWLATTLVLTGFGILLLLILLLLVPLVQGQVVQLLDTLPRISAWVREKLLPLLDNLIHRLSDEDLERLRSAAGQYAGNLVGWVASIAGNVVTRGVALFDVLSLVFITPVVAFYLLRDWDAMIARIESLLPLEHRETILGQVAEIDRTLAGFVRGQASVCLALGLFYALALSLAGLNFGLVIGLLSGFLSFIPFVGSLFGFVGSVGIALFQYEDWLPVGLVAGIFLLGQAVEGNVLTPRLVGDRVGLHPVWVIFALLAGGSLFGFVGVLLAVPVAAVIGVLVRFALSQYLASRYFTGPEPPAGEAL